jgi:hypothetical protein
MIQNPLPAPVSNPDPPVPLNLADCRSGEPGGHHSRGDRSPHGAAGECPEAYPQTGAGRVGILPCVARASALRNRSPLMCDDSFCRRSTSSTTGESPGPPTGAIFSLAARSRGVTACLLVDCRLERIPVSLGDCRSLKILNLQVCPRLVGGLSESIRERSAVACPAAEGPISSCVRPCAAQPASSTRGAPRRRQSRSDRLSSAKHCGPCPGGQACSTTRTRVMEDSTDIVFADKVSGAAKSAPAWAAPFIL